jgi:putative DNA primase/helicase
MNTLEAAKDLLSRGFRITLCDPVVNPKHPLGIGWKADRYDKHSAGDNWGNKVWTPEEIDAAFASRGELNVGLVLGPDNNLIDIESDSAEQEAAFAELCGELPTVTATFTSTRGKHRLFAYHPGLAAATSDRGVITYKSLGIRTGNGFQVHSVFPPSTGRSWLLDLSLDECHPAQLPDDVVEKIVEASKSSAPPAQHHAPVGNAITEGRRNETLYRSACRMRRDGKELHDIEQALSEENVKRCHPPLAAHELSTIARSACKHKPAAAVLLSENRTEVENGRRFARDYAREGAELVRYVEKWRRFIVWAGKRWEIDEQNIRVEKLAKKSSDQLWDDITAVLPSADKATAGKLLTWHKQSASLRGLRAAIDLARGEDGVLISHTELDQHPFLLNVQNGTVDLLTGKLREHRREDLLTQIAPVNFDPEATCPRWCQFIAEIMNHKQELIEFLHRFCGYAISGDVSEHIFPIFFGGGSNGKSVFLKILQLLLGEYSKKCTADMLLVKKHDALPIERADLFAKRLAFSIEIDAGRRLSEGLLKELTGGDAITARHLYQENFTFDATHKIVMACNHKPVIRGADDGIWRRIALVPFDVHFWNADKGETGKPELQQDKNLLEQLKAELPGILNWCIFGFLKWRATKSLAIPEKVREATEQYKQDSDIYAMFISEKCTLSDDPEHSAGSQLLYDTFKKWCLDNSLAVDSVKVFGNKLQERGFVRKHTKLGKVFTGLRLRVEAVD